VIAIVYPQFYGVGGIARYLASFLENLPPGSPPIVLITGDKDRVPVAYPGVEIVHVPVSSSRFNLVIWSSTVRKLLRELYAQKKIRYVNFHWPPLIPGLFLPPEIPLVLTAHTTYLGMSGRFYPERHFQSQWSDASLAVKMWMERRVFKIARKVITLTEQGRQEVLSYGFKGDVTVIPNGADTQKFAPTAGVSKDIDVLFSGRIEQRKGSRGMVTLCQRLVAARPNIRICIVGYGEDEAFVREALTPLSPAVELTGKVPFEKMVNYYNRSRVYASTAYYEGLPGTCLEALAMQLPAVVWDYLFYRGLVVPGETGLIAPSNDFDAMSAHIFKLLDDRAMAQAYGENGRRLLTTQYDWKSLAAEIVGEFG
jgi:glycosyltransferase involved in cell wall biosynthesis